MHSNIVIADQQYQNNLHNYHLVKNMNRAIKIIAVAAIRNQLTKGAKYMVMGYDNKSFVEFMSWLHVWYSQIMPRDLIMNQEKMQATYNIKDPIEILFDQIEMIQ